MLRAIKYAAKTDSKMSFLLRHKIRHSADLLNQISPSRLTEELLKIINSGLASKIIAEALDTDLYMALQPAATGMMYENKKFEVSYMKNMAKLDALIKEEPDARLGKKLVFLITDFIENLTDWKKETAESFSSGELYKKTWTECRNFILPMNPQRTELEFAIKSVLTNLGVPLKKIAPKKTYKKEKSKAQIQN